MAIVVALASVAAAPAGALAAGEGSAGTTTPAEAGVESPVTPTETSSPGWTAQDPATGTSGSKAGSVRRGSSVGSGAVREQPHESGEAPSHASEESSYVGGSPGEYESEATTPSTAVEPVGTTSIARGAGSERSRGAKAKVRGSGDAAVGSARPVARPASAPDVSATPVAATQVAPVATQTVHTGSGSGLLWWLAAIMGALILAMGGTILRRRHLLRRQEATQVRLDAEWKATLRRIEEEYGEGVSHMEVARVEPESPLHQGDPAPAEEARRGAVRAVGG